jgi:hypothetical protein
VAQAAIERLAFRPRTIRHAIALGSTANPKEHA